MYFLKRPACPAIRFKCRNSRGPKSTELSKGRSVIGAKRLAIYFYFHFLFYWMANFTDLDFADAAKAVGSLRFAVMKIGDLCNGFCSVSFTNAQCDLQKVRNAQNYLPVFQTQRFLQNWSWCLQKFENRKRWQHECIGKIHERKR